MPLSSQSVRALAWLGAPLAAACMAAAAQQTLPPPPATAAVPARLVTFTTGLNTPWSLAFLPGGEMLVTERPGRLRVVSADGKQVSAPLIGVPAVDASGQGGLFDVMPDRDFARSRRIFLSYAEAGTGADSGRNGTAVMSARLSADLRSLTDQQVIFRQSPKRESNAHFGGRLAQSAGGLVFVTLGDRRQWADDAQSLGGHVGKVVRIRRDGSVPPTNPFVGVSGAKPEIWSLGHRNPQGAAIHPVTGDLWTNEHGPQGGDEVNVDRRGRNYGWPRISWGCDYGAPVPGCTPVGGASTAPGLEQPVTRWGPYSIAPSGMAFYTADRFPEWRGNVFVGALAGQALWRLTLDGNRVVGREALFQASGYRIRDVRQGPDGWLYLLTDDANGRILRVER